MGALVYESGCLERSEGVLVCDYDFQRKVSGGLLLCENECSNYLIYYLVFKVCHWWCEQSQSFIKLQFHDSFPPKS